MSPVLCVGSVAVEVGMLVLLSSSLMPVLLESKQMTSCLADFTSFCDDTDAEDDGTCCVMSPEEWDRNHSADKRIIRTKKTGYCWLLVDQRLSLWRLG